MIDIKQGCAQAQILNDQHEIEASIKCWSVVLSEAPDCSIARYALIRLCLEISDFERAQTLCETGQSYPDDALVLAACSHYFQSVYDVQSALDFSRRAWACDTDSPQAAYAYHGSLLLSGDELGARDFLATIDGQFDAYSELEVERASRAEIGPNEQCDLITKVVDRYPNCRTARFVLITALNGLHQEERTQDALEWLMSRSPKSGDVQGLGALLALQKDQMELAAERSDTAVHLNPFSVLGHFVQFHLALWGGHREAAFDIVRRVESWAENSISAFTLVPQMWEQLNDFEGIRERLIQKYTAGNRSPEIGLSLSRMSLKQGNEEDGLYWVKAARAPWVSHFDATIDLARLLVERGEMEDGAALIKDMMPCESVDELRLRIDASSGADMGALVSGYEAYLKQYPSFDFVWGTLLRYYLESADEAGVDWLLKHPRPVPQHVRYAVNAYRAVVNFDIESAESQLKGFLNTRTTDARWLWCWELVLESLEEPRLNDWLVPLAEAAKLDGL